MTDTAKAWTFLMLFVGIFMGYLLPTPGHWIAALLITASAAAHFGVAQYKRRLL